MREDERERTDGKRYGMGREGEIETRLEGIEKV